MSRDRMEDSFIGRYGDSIVALTTAGAVVAFAIFVVGVMEDSRNERIASDAQDIQLQIDDFAHLGEGVVLIGDQDCPPTERPLGDSEATVYEFLDGGVEGYLFSIRPEAVYQSEHAPAIFCGPDAGLGNPFEGNAIVIAGGNTAYSAG